MNSRPDRLRLAIDALQADDLMPPVKDLEMGSGGWIRVTVVGECGDELRARIAAAMGATRWKLVVASDHRVTGVTSRREDS